MTEKKIGKREHFATGGLTWKEKVERAFGKMDRMLRLSSSFWASCNFLSNNRILAGVPECDKCNNKMAMGAGNK